MRKIFDTAPDELDASTSVGELLIYTNPSARNAAVELEPIVPDDEEALKIIERSAPNIGIKDGKLRVKVRDDAEGGGGTTIVQSNGSISIVGNGVVIGSARGVTVVNGKVIQAGAGNVVQIGGGGVRAVIRVPASIATNVRTQAGEVRVYGDLAQFSAEASSGGIEALGHLHKVDVEVSSGGARLGVVDRLEARASSGSLAVESVQAYGRVRVSSGSAHVHTETANFRARASSGSLHITTAPGVVLDEDDVTVSSGSRRVSVRR